MAITTKQTLKDVGCVVTELEPESVDASSTQHAAYYGGRRTKTNKHIVIDFDSPAQLSSLPAYEGASRNPRSWTYGQYATSHDATAAALKTGTVPEPLFEKYLEIRERLQPVIDKYAGMGMSTKRRRVRREEGNELDIDRMMTGDPACWESRIRGKKKRLVRLAIQYGYVAGANEQTFIRGAALAAAAADVLGKLGYAVEIVGVAWGQKWSSKNEYLVNVKMKGANDPLDPQNLLTVGLPGMSRDFEFAVYDAFEGVSGMGMAPMSKRMAAHVGHTALIAQDFKLNKDGVNYDEAIENFLTEAQAAAQSVR